MNFRARMKETKQSFILIILDLVLVLLICGPHLCPEMKDTRGRVCLDSRGITGAQARRETNKRGGGSMHCRDTGAYPRISVLLFREISVAGI
ncbi:hypothetical protein KQX54_016181 [Cotesia glomerata]|uniref:Secreted protein n=1 Tax=Cotesia glomerata TaxID=32391 RepID=A0AAV7I9L3_COTGL|nr:hypothetical protein KQX54_016181 [Cotesia glomerata]